MKKLLLGCTGAISILNIPSLILDLRVDHQADIQVVMTAAAQKFITPFSLEVLTGKPVVTDMYSSYESFEGNLVRPRSLFLIAPATANTVSKVAGGISDNVVTWIASLYLGAGVKVVMAPSVNVSVWANPLLQQNLKKLELSGVEIIAPGEGICMAEMSKAETAMAQPKAIIDRVLRFLD